MSSTRRPREASYPPEVTQPELTAQACKPGVLDPQTLGMTLLLLITTANGLVPGYAEYSRAHEEVVAGWALG